VTRHMTVEQRVKLRFERWLADVRGFAIAADHVIDASAPFWRECFDDGMSPYQAWQESFVEQDGI
jgi:hypothetical protein